MQKATLLLSAALLLGLTVKTHAQHLTAAGISGSFNVARLYTGQGAFQLGNSEVSAQARGRLPRRDHFPRPVLPIPCEHLRGWATLVL